MFGYVTVNIKALSDEDKKLYQQYYCGLCRCLQQRHGNLSRFTLSNDMTFLLILYSSLYEPDEEAFSGRCLLHPIKRREYIRSEACDYCADMTVLLAYLKSKDDEADEGGMQSKLSVKMMSEPFQRVQQQYPEKVQAVEAILQELSVIEKEECRNIDIPMNLSAKMLGEIFAYREDYWQNDLRKLGEALGRFIYFMDAYDDLKADVKKGRYNALRYYQDQENFEAFCEESLLMMIAECADVFETLPLERHLSILRNVLYSGVWTRYWQKTGKGKNPDETNVEITQNQTDE